MALLPPIAWLLVLKVWVAVPALKVPLLVMPPRNVTDSLDVLVQLLLGYTVTSPTKTAVPVADDWLRVATSVPSPMLVGPLT